jgi:hypothetical protein
MHELMAEFQADWKLSGRAARTAVEYSRVPDHELTPERFAEVRDELFEDMLLGDRPTNRHLGTLRTSIPKRGLAYAARWRQHHTLYPPSPTPRAVTVEDLF